MYEGKKIGVIIVAGGSGTRMESDIPKQFIEIDGIPMIKKTALAFERSPYVDDICVVANIKFIELYRNALSGITKLKCIAAGGRERQDSVGNGMREFSKVSDFEYVMVHDGARPYVTEKIIEDNLAEVVRTDACITAVPVKDTIRHQRITLERKDLYIVQTPQTFKRELLAKALERAASDGYTGTDDGSLVERLGRPVAIVNGDYSNIKITTKEDLPMQIRTGIGYDVHKLSLGRKLIIGGVDIPNEKGLLGHSDADVLLHAIMDSLLGAAALGDIGKHFPDKDPSFKDISSMALTGHVRMLLEKEGYGIGNIDATIIAQEPKMAPYIEEMRKNIAKALEIDVDKVSVKATTEEGLGFTGKGEGIAAQAVCTIMKN